MLFYGQTYREKCVEYDKDDFEKKNKSLKTLINKLKKENSKLKLIIKNEEKEI